MTSDEKHLAEVTEAYLYAFDQAKDNVIENPAKANVYTILAAVVGEYLKHHGVDIDGIRDQNFPTFGGM